MAWEKALLEIGSHEHGMEWRELKPSEELLERAASWISRNTRPRNTISDAEFAVFGELFCDCGVQWSVVTLSNNQMVASVI